MSIKQTYLNLQTVATSVLPTFQFYGMSKMQYNTVNDVKDNVLIVEPVRQWPINVRNGCQTKFTIKVWIGIRLPITSGNETMEYPPYHEIDIRDTLINVAVTYVNGLNNFATFQVLNNLNEGSLIATILDAPDGGSTNWQAWCSFSLNMVQYETVEIITFDNTTVTFDSNLITFDNG